MAIINMGSHSSVFEGRIGVIEGAYSPLEMSLGAYTGKPTSYFLYETFVGCCIRDEERNGYDDSDFSMLVWNEETQSAEWDHYATTRAWCYPCFGSRVDATPEVLAKYNAWKSAREAHYKRVDAIKAVCAQRKKNAVDRQIARFYGVEVSQVRKLRNLYNEGYVEAMHKLLFSNLRSEFRKSLRKQLITWLEGRGKFDKPFSPKQLQYI